MTWWLWLLAAFYALLVLISPASPFGSWTYESAEYGRYLITCLLTILDSVFFLYRYASYLVPGHMIFRIAIIVVLVLFLANLALSIYYFRMTQLVFRAFIMHPEDFPDQAAYDAFYEKAKSEYEALSSRTWLMVLIEPARYLALVCHLIGLVSLCFPSALVKALSLAQK